MDTFKKLVDDFFSLYEKHAYADALTLVQTGRVQFPEHRTELITWEICMLGRLGRLDEAIAALDTALESTTYWWMPIALRKDPDLAALQDIPEYQRLVAICEDRMQQAQANNRPKRIVFEPANPPAGALPLLLVFHGWGQDAEITAPYWRGLAAQGWLVAVTCSSLEAADGLFTWDDFERGMNEAQEHYQALCRDFVVDPRRVLLGGFSQGGGLAAWLAMSQTIPAAGLIGVGPYLNTIDTLGPSLPQKPIPGVRFYVISGEFEEDQGMFAKMGALCARHEIPFEHEKAPGLGHEYPDDFSPYLQRALGFIFSS